MPFRRPTSHCIRASGFTPLHKVLIVVEQDSSLSRKHLAHPEQPLFGRRVHVVCFHHAFPIPCGMGLPKTYNRTSEQ